MVASASELKDASVAYPKALPIRDKLVLVFVPHVPEAAPVVISSNRKLLSKLAISSSYDGLTGQSLSPDPSGPGLLNWPITVCRNIS